LSFLAGCDGLIVTQKDYDVEAIAKTWPPYHPPHMAANIQQPDSNAIRRLPPPDPRRQSVIDGLENSMRLIRPHTEWNFPETAMDSLGRIGAAAVPELVRTLEHDDPVHRQRAAEVLARIGPEASQAVPALIQRLDDTQQPVRLAAARALGQIGPDAEAAVEPLIRALQSETGNERP
jgi:HEAT repeat protein